MIIGGWIRISGNSVQVYAALATVLPARAPASTSAHPLVFHRLLLLLTHLVGLVGGRVEHAAALVIGLGRDVTAARGDPARALARSRPPKSLLSQCMELLLSAWDGTVATIGRCAEIADDDVQEVAPVWLCATKPSPSTASTVQPGAEPRGRLGPSGSNS